MSLRRRPEYSRTWTWGAILTIAVVSVLHYTTHGDIGNLASHTLFRRVYYLPIAVLAVVHGMRGGGLAAGVVALVYSPHAFMGGPTNVLGIHLHGDPSPTLEKLSEIVLYLSLGLLVGFAVDRARDAQKSLEEARTELERSARLSALGKLVAGVAHEVRNPLASLHTTAELFLDDYDEGHEKRRMAELNLQEVKRLEGVVERFLAFARPGQPRREPTNVGGLLERVKDLARSTASERSVTIAVEATDEERLVVDPDQLIQVLLNLVLNAIDASPDGGTIWLGARCDDDRCDLEVKDEGKGVALEIQERIFDPFFTTRAEGTGLGLSLASKIAEAHGGGISYRDRDGGGAHFCVHLPRGAGASVEAGHDAAGTA